MKYRVYRQVSGTAKGVEYLGRKEYIKTFYNESEADAYATRMDEINVESYGYEEVEDEPMPTADDIGKMSREDIEKTLTEYGYYDERGYKVTIELPNEDVISSHTSYSLAAGYIYDLIKLYPGCYFLIEGHANQVAFWISSPEKLVKYLPWKPEENKQDNDGPCDQDGILEELYCRGMISEREYLNHYDIEPENERY